MIWRSVKKIDHGQSITRQKNDHHRWVLKRRKYEVASKVLRLCCTLVSIDSPSVHAGHEFGVSKKIRRWVENHAYMKDSAQRYFSCRISHSMITGYYGLEFWSGYHLCLRWDILRHAHLERGKHNQVSRWNRQQFCVNDRKIFTSASWASSQPLLYLIDTWSYPESKGVLGVAFAPPLYCRQMQRSQGWAPVLLQPHFLHCHSRACYSSSDWQAIVLGIPIWALSISTSIEDRGSPAMLCTLCSLIMPDLKIQICIQMGGFGAVYAAMI